MKMSIVSSFCFSYPLGSGVIFSVYHVPYHPPAFGKLHTWSQLRFLCALFLEPSGGKESLKSSACLR